MMPGYFWEDCAICEGTVNFEYDTCRACLGEGGRWMPVQEADSISEQSSLPENHENT